jgi:hypothetical protein
LLTPAYEGRLFASLPFSRKHVKQL